jgi:hypothetical protein
LTETLAGRATNYDSRARPFASTIYVRDRLREDSRVDVQGICFRSVCIDFHSTNRLKPRFDEASREPTATRENIDER